MTSGERCPVNVRERFRSANHERHGELFVKRMSRARGNVLLARVMIASDREHCAFEFAVCLSDKFADAFVGIPKVTEDAQLLR